MCGSVSGSIVVRSGPFVEISLSGNFWPGLGSDPVCSVQMDPEGPPLALKYECGPKYFAGGTAVGPPGQRNYCFVLLFLSV